MLPLWKKKGLFDEEYDLVGSETVEFGSAPPLLQQFSRHNSNARCFLHFELLSFSIYVQHLEKEYLRAA